MLVSIVCILYCSINIMCYDVSVLTQSSKDRAKPNHQSPLMLTKPLQITGFSGTSVVLRSSLTVPLGALMMGILHVQHTRKPWKAWEQRILHAYIPSHKQN